MDSMPGLFFDISILTVITLSALLGYRKGLFISFTGILRSLICIVFAALLSDSFSNFIADYSTLDESLLSHIKAGIDSALSDALLSCTLPADLANLMMNGSDNITQEIAENATAFILHIVAFLVLVFAFRILSSIITNLSIFSNRRKPSGCINGMLGFVAGALKGYITVCIILLSAIPVLAILGPELSLLFINGFRDSYTVPFLFIHNPLLYLLNLN